MRAVLLALLALPALAAEIVLLLEQTPGMRGVIAGTRIPELRPDDRLALVTFAARTKVRQSFTGDREKLAGWFRRRQSSIQAGAAVRRRQSEVRLFAAIVEACRLFDGGPAAR
jgi:hypothetical protein